MFQRLILLWGACLALVLSISSCGGDSEDFKPVNKTGALDGGAPDVILFVLDSPKEGGTARDLASMKVPDGVRFSAAYARHANPYLSLHDLCQLGQAGVETDSTGTRPADSALFKAFDRGGYSTRVVAGAELEDYLAEESDKPRFALVLTSSIFEWWFHVDLVSSYQLGMSREGGSEPTADHKEDSARNLLTVWTFLPPESKSWVLTERQLHVPLVFSMPGTFPEKQEHTQVVSLADVGVTILDLCGLLPEGTRPSDNEGASFARILQKKPLAWRGFVLAKTASGDGWIRSTRWRLSHSTANGLTLSYIEKDPLNTRDDSDLPGAQAQLEGLGGRLDAWLK